MKDINFNCFKNLSIGINGERLKNFLARLPKKTKDKLKIDKYEKEIKITRKNMKLGQEIDRFRFKLQNAINGNEADKVNAEILSNFFNEFEVIEEERNLLQNEIK